MSFPFQLGDLNNIVASSGYEGSEADIYEAGVVAGALLLSDYFQDRQQTDLTQFRGQIARVYSDLSYQMKWISDQLNDEEV